MQVQFRIVQQVIPYSEGFSSMGILAVKVKACCLRAGDARWEQWNVLVSWSVVCGRDSSYARTLWE